MTNSFTLPVAHDIPVLTASEYEELFPGYAPTIPKLFSISLDREICEFKSSVAPALPVTIGKVIDLACFYYGDPDPCYSVVDELLHTDDCIDQVLRDLYLKSFSPDATEQLLEAQIDVMRESTRDLVKVIHNVLDNTQCSAIEEFGSNYRLDSIHGEATLLFRLVTPEDVAKELEEERNNG